MLSKPKTTGPAKTVRFRKRKQKRNKSRPLESVDQDWARWDAAAELEGVNWSEFCRRALNERTARNEQYQRRRMLGPEFIQPDEAPIGPKG
jgi:hypothetical protein